MAKITAICNQKGGVGKTVTAVNLGIGLAREGKRVLLADVDAQGSLTASLGYQHPDQMENTLAELLGHIISDEPLPPDMGILHQAEGVDLLPVNIELSGLEVTLVNTMSRETVLREYLNGIRDQYDVILLDCCPSLGMLNYGGPADHLLSEHHRTAPQRLRGQTAHFRQHHPPLTWPIIEDSRLSKGTARKYRTAEGRFYTYRSSCLPVFELLQYADETWESKINVGALKNAILKFHPDYAEDTPCIPPDMELIMSPGAGFDFYAFPQEP